MSGTATIFEEAVHRQVIDLLGEEQVGSFLDVLASRLDELGSLSDEALAQPEALAKVHKVVSEAGLIGFTRLSSACSDFENESFLNGAPPSGATFAELRRSIALTNDKLEQMRQNRR